MSSHGYISICHDDETLIAELSFWATSAGYELVRQDRKDMLSAAEAPKLAAAILQLTGTGDNEIDIIETLSARYPGKVMAVTTLDAKTISSVRRLFQAKSVEAILISRSEFSTRQISDLMKTKEKRPELDRQVLADSIAQGHVVVHYQPKVPFRTDSQSYGVEALCRLQHPELGMIYPDSFIPLAEAHDLILELTDAVTVQAFKTLKSWDEQGLKLRMAVNISPRLMGDMTWFELFERRCEETEIDPARITLEVTESSSQGGKVLALEILSRLRLKGFLLSIDDFGTGFSSLETLYKLPFGELKIDKGFVLDLQKNSEARTLVETTVGLARKLGLKIVAEGVETEELFQELRELQCDDAQGYFISKPVAADMIVPFFRQWDSEKQRLAGPVANKLQVIHGLLAEILSAPDDGEDETVVLSATPSAKSGQDSAGDVAARIPALVMAGDMVGALAHVHRAVQSNNVAPALSQKLLSLQNEIERSLATMSVELSHTPYTTQLLGAASVTIGRESTSSKGDISIPCPWLSRASKNLRLSISDAQWHICDLGSTNGHFIGDARLAANQPVPLAAGETLVEVGKNGAGVAPAWLRFRVGGDNSVEVSFGINGDADASATAAIHHKWIVFEREFSAGKAGEAGLVAGNATEALADIAIRDSGLWITPRAGHVIKLGNHEFSQAVPLAAGHDLSLGAATWSVTPAGQTQAADVSTPLASAVA